MWLQDGFKIAQYTSKMDPTRPQECLEIAGMGIYPIYTCTHALFCVWLQYKMLESMHVMCIHIGHCSLRRVREELHAPPRLGLPLTHRIALYGTTPRDLIDSTGMQFDFGYVFDFGIQSCTHRPPSALSSPVLPPYRPRRALKPLSKLTTRALKVFIVPHRLPRSTWFPKPLRHPTLSGQA